MSMGRMKKTVSLIPALVLWVLLLSAPVCFTQDCPSGQYGIECRETCSDNCKVPGDCDSINGTCYNGCNDGYTGDLCDEMCDTGKYGPGCVYNCSDVCDTTRQTQLYTSCHHVNGTCVYGCNTGYTGFLCMEAVNRASSDNSPGLGLGLGLGLGIPIIMAIVAVSIYCYRRKVMAGKPRGDNSPVYDTPEQVTDQHNYNEMFQPDTGRDIPVDITSSTVKQDAPAGDDLQDTVQCVNIDFHYYEDIDSAA